MTQANQQLFEEFRSFHFPQGEYAITSSGPLGVRNVREIFDIDVVVSDKLWAELKKKYGTITEDNICKIRLSDNIEVLGEGSFFTPRDSDEPNVDEQIHTAETINGLQFVKLEYILFFKKKMNRSKDKKDIESIQKILRSST